MVLTLLDLDQTLLRGDSDCLWLDFLIEKGIRPASDHKKLDEFMRQYHAGTMNILEYLMFQVGPLGKHSPPTLEAWRSEFVQKKILPDVSSKARKLAKKAAQDSDFAVLITATNVFIAEPIAQEFGLEHFIATKLEKQNGRFTGRPLGTPCFREGKITCLDEWLHARQLRWENFSQTSFYSDSNNDIPLLTRVKKPVAVDPDPALRAHAAKMGWDIISLAD